MSKNSMTVLLSKDQFDSLKFYTGIRADRYIAPKDDVINHLHMFLSKQELEYLRSNDCNYSVIFEEEDLNIGMTQRVK